MKSLIEEREELQKRLDWLGIRSTGSERIERRINEIDKLLKRGVVIGDRGTYKTS